MFVYIFLLTVLFFTNIKTEQYNGSLCIVQNPKGYIFNSVKKPLDFRTVQNLFAVATGHPQKAHKSKWAGLIIRNPFLSGEVVVILQLEGFEGCGIENSLKIKASFNTKIDTNKIWKFLSAHQEHTHENTLIKLDVENANSEKSIFKASNCKKIKTSLDLTVLETANFVNEMNMLNHITKNLNKIRKIKRHDVFWFKLKSLGPFIKKHGMDSTYVETALHLLATQINFLKEKFANYYDIDKLLFVIVNNLKHYKDSDEEQVSREQEEEELNKVENPVEARTEIPCDEFKEDQCVKDISMNEWQEQFMIRKFRVDNFTNDNNIIDISIETHLLFWSSFALFFSLLATCLAIMEMDVGKDSIIYKLTDPRKQTSLFR